MLVTKMMNIEFIGQVSIYIGLGIQVLMALVLGGLVGLDREQKMKAAGLKTNMLICIGATLYTTISMLVVDAHVGGAIDPNRMSAQIVSGIGFLGAGAIFQGKGNITGLTTAATIWVVAAIGYTIGAGYPFSAAIFTITVISVLKLIKPFNNIFENKKDFQAYHLEVLSIGSIIKVVKEIIEDEDNLEYDLNEIEIEDNKDRRILNINIICHSRAIERIYTEIENLIKVEKSNYRLTPSELENIKG